MKLRFKEENSATVSVHAFMVPPVDPISNGHNGRDIVGNIQLEPVAIRKLINNTKAISYRLLSFLVTDY